MSVLKGERKFQKCVLFAGEFTLSPCCRVYFQISQEKDIDAGTV